MACAAAILAQEFHIRVIERVGIASFDYKNQGKFSVIKPVAKQVLDP